MDDYRRFLVASVAVLLSALLVIAGLLYWQDRRLTDATASEHLDTIRLAQRLVESQQSRDLGTRAELIAGNQAVVGYISQALGDALPGASVDRKSIIDLLEERRDQLGLAVAAVLGADGRLVATTERFSDEREFGAEPLFLAATRAQSLQSGLWNDGARLLHIAILPLSAYGSGEAYLLVGVPVGQEFANTIAEIGATEVALVAMTPDGPLVTASTFAPEQQVALLAALPAKAGKPEQRLSIELDGRGHRASLAPIFGSDSARLVALVSPRRDAVAFGALRLPMIVGGVLLLLALAVASRLLWSRVLEPAGTLLKVMERAADSHDLRLTAPETGSPAISRLASAFNRLLAGLQR